MRGKVGVRIKELRIRSHLMRLIFGEARERQPQAGHALAKPRRGEEPVHHALESIRRGIGEEGLQFRG